MKLAFLTALSVAALSSIAFAGVNPPAPTPEPASIGLIAAGLGGVGFMAWKKRRK